MSLIILLGISYFLGRGFLNYLGISATPKAEAQATPQQPDRGDGRRLQTIIIVPSASQSNCLRFGGGMGCFDRVENVPQLDAEIVRGCPSGRYLNGNCWDSYRGR